MMMKLPRFNIQQIALCPTNPTKARQLLEDLGLTEWFVDNVHASGVVRGASGQNNALLQFNYQAGNGSDAEAGKPLELELLHYTQGNNWMLKNPNTVSHLGMHCTFEELEQFRSYFYKQGIGIAQEVSTLAHTNPAIKDSRRYQYAIFDTRDILGVDLKFIVRRELPSVSESDANRAIVAAIAVAESDAGKECLGPVQGAKLSTKLSKNEWKATKANTKAVKK